MTSSEDLISVDLHQPNMQPQNNIVKNTVCSGNKKNIIMTMTMINGRALYRDGMFYVPDDIELVYDKTSAIIKRIKKTV